MLQCVGIMDITETASQVEDLGMLQTRLKSYFDCILTATQFVPTAPHAYL